MVRELETKVVFTTDESQKNKAIKAYKDLQKAQERVAKDALRTGKAYDEVAKELRIIDKASRDVGKTLDALDDKWRANVDGAETLEDQIKRLNDTFDETSRQVGSFGDIQSNIGAVRGIAGAAGLGGVDVGLGVAGEVVALGEELPRLKDALKAAGPAVQVTTDAIGLGGLAGGFQALFPALGATGASIAALSAVALPLIAIGGLLALSFSKIAEQQERVIQFTRLQFEAQAEVEKLLREGATTDEFLASRQQAVDDLRDAEARLQQAREGRADAGSFTAAREFERIIEETQQEVLDAGVRLNEFNNAVFDTELAANDAVQAEQDLSAERQLAVEETDRLADIAERAAIADANRLETEALNQEFANEDQLAQEQEHQDNLAKIASDGKSNIEAISSELNNIPSERLQAISDAESEGNAKLQNARDDFFGKSQDNLEKFQRDSAKIETETSKKRIRLLEDVQDRLDDAVRANDVIAFLRIQRESEKQIARGIVDEEAAEQERVQRFIEAQQKEREAFNAKQAEIQLAIQAERTAINESFSERREQLLENLELERAAIEDRRLAEIARFDEQEAREEQTAERQRRRQELRDSQQDAAAQRQAQRLNAEQQAAEQAHARELQRIAEIDRAIQSIQPPPAAQATTREPQHAALLVQAPAHVLDYLVVSLILLVDLGNVDPTRVRLVDLRLSMLAVV
jgi:hypothetical protein